MLEFDVLVEIPKGERNKYEVDHESGRIRLDRMLFTAMAYPSDYGYVEESLGEDGDPLEVAGVSGAGRPGNGRRGEPSLADINLMPFAARLDYLGLLDLWIEERPRVQAWWAMARAWPSFRTGLRGLQLPSLIHP